MRAVIAAAYFVAEIITSSTSSPEDSDRTATSGDAVTGHPSTVHLPFPSFWVKKSRAWFCQVEAQFHLRNITSQRTRYYHVVAHLPLELADELHDLLVALLSDAPYGRLQETILHRTADSESSRLRQLLNA